jgi:hypothetical protein
VFLTLLPFGILWIAKYLSIDFDRLLGRSIMMMMFLLRCGLYFSHMAILL